MTIARLNDNIPYSALGNTENLCDVFAKVNELVDAHNTLEAQVREMAGSAWHKKWDAQPAGGVEVVDA